MFLTETWQRDGEFIHLNELCPPNCSAVGVPRPCRRGGGLATVHRDSYLCRGMNIEPFPSFESQMIKIGSSNMFYWILIYRPPGPAGVFLNDFNEFISSIIKLEKVLILGDFNLHIDDDSSSPAVELLYMTETFNFKQHVSGPTHIKGHTLDLVFSLGLHFADVRVEEVHMSEHSCVFFELHLPPEPKPLKKRTERRIITETTAERFCAMFDPCLLNECADEVNSLMHCLNSHCAATLDQVAPFKTNYASQERSCPWINECILNLRRMCRKTERLWKSSRLEVHRLHLREQISHLNNMIKEARASYFYKLIASNKKNPKVLFDTINLMVSPAAPATPVLCKINSNEFSKIFIDKIRDIKDKIPPASCCDPDHVETPSLTWSSFKPVSLEDISALMVETKPSSSASDVLPSRLLIKVLDLIGPWVTKIFNLSLSSGVFPGASWNQNLKNQALTKLNQ